MAKVKRVKAQKDYPDHGVAKGEMCYVWSLKTGPRSSRAYRQKEPPKPWQLTTSEFLGTVYQLNEQIENLSEEDLADNLQTLIDEIQALGEEQDEKWNNLPEGFQQGDTGMRLEARRDSCEEWASNLEAARDNIPDEPEWKLDELPDAPVEPEPSVYAEPEHYDAAFAKWEAQFARWEEQQDEAESYEREMDDVLSEAQVALYEGE